MPSGSHVPYAKAKKSSVRMMDEERSPGKQGYGKLAPVEKKNGAEGSPAAPRVQKVTGERIARERQPPGRVRWNVHEKSDPREDSP